MLPTADPVPDVIATADPVFPVLCVVFSKDRPLQLDATLRSLIGCCADLVDLDIQVLYTTSSSQMDALYQTVATEHRSVSFHREENFKRDLLRLLEASSFVLFLVDDTLVVDTISIDAGVRVLASEPSCLAFSYRLGRNTTYCYTKDKLQRLPPFETLDAGVLTFDWTIAEHDFGYPLEISSSLYRSEDILPLLRALAYRNPNTLESAMAQQVESFRSTRSRLACYAVSIAFSVPANIVQTAWRNRADTNPSMTVEALADAYARGQRLDIERYQGYVPNACHQEIEFFYTQRPDVPSVSVVIPCYEQAEYLNEAVASVVSQTFVDWELIIVDDGSPDDTALVAGGLITKYPERRIRLIRQSNAGLAEARNAGIASARGRYILPLDADDVIAPSLLEETVAVLDHESEPAIVYTDRQNFGAAEDLFHAGRFDTDSLTEWDTLSYCSLYRREVWHAVGGYNPNMTWGYEDWDFWLGCLEHGYQARHIPRPLFLYRVRPSSMTSSAMQHDRQLRRQMRLNHAALYSPKNRINRRARRLAYGLVNRARRLVRPMRSPVED